VVQISYAIARAIADLAQRQYGAIARWQLVALGLPDSGTARWVKQGRLHRVYWGVYLLDHSVAPPLALEQAALLAVKDSVLSHFTAAWLHGLLPRRDGPVHVTTRRHRGRPDGIRVHTSRRLDRRDTTHRRGLRVTTVARTLIDLAETAPARDLERALETAIARRLTTDRQLRALVQRSRGRRGAAVLRALLDFRGDDGYSRSRAEDAMRALARRARLPQPAVNARVGGYEVDFSWMRQRLIVEIDSWAHHAGRDQFEYDRRKAADLQAAGWTVMRITWRQLTTEPEATAARIAGALALASA
jgi:very-short-patch-repair endonuclease